MHRQTLQPTRSKPFGHEAAIVTARMLLPHVRRMDAMSAPACGSAHPAPAQLAASLLDRAADWVDSLRARQQTHVFYPVARLRRRFGIGHRATCALVEMLALRGEWTVRCGGGGTRYARIHPRAAAPAAA